MEKKEKKCMAIGGITGLVIGAGLMIGGENIKSPTESAKMMEINDNPKIMKVYNLNKADQILVENPDNAREYITLGKYLREFDNKYKRNFEKAKIKLIVSQNENIGEQK